MALNGMLRRVFRRGSASATMAQVAGLRAVAMAVNLGTGLISAAALGPAGRGELAALILAPPFLASLATLGLHASLIYNMRANPAEERRLLGAALLLGLCGGLAITALGWALLPLWLHRYGVETVRAARWLLLVTPLGVIAPILNGALEAHGRFGVANRTLCLQGLLTLAALALLWRWQALTPTTAALAYLFPNIPTVLYFRHHVVRIAAPRWTASRAVAGRLLRYGLRFYGIDLLGGIAPNLDQIIIAALLPQAQVGLYVVALSLSRVPTVLQGAITSVLFPRVAAQARASVVETVARTMRFSVLVNAAVAGGMAVAGPWALQFLYGERFAGAIAPLQILLAETLVSNMARILYQAFSASGRPGVVAGFEGAGLITSALAMLLIVPGWGIEGAACCVMLASLARLGSVLALLPRLLDTRMPRLLPNMTDFMALVGR